MQCVEKIVDTDRLGAQIQSKDLLLPRRRDCQDLTEFLFKNDELDKFIIEMHKLRSEYDSQQ